MYKGVENRLFGRRQITTNETVITSANVVEVINEALKEHEQNRREIETLYDEYKGKQNILNRSKTIRPEICNKIVENHHNEIVSFKTGYLCGEPIQYVTKNSDKSIADEIVELNGFMSICSKDALDDELIEWVYICGQGYRMVYPHRTLIKDKVVPKLKRGEKADFKDEAPFNIYTLDPRNTFVVYSTELERKPVCAVKYITKQDKNLVLSVWTENGYFEIEKDASPVVNKTNIISVEDNPIGIPIVEYLFNNARLGAFEIVRDILNALNGAASNRADAIEQFVQSLMVLYNCDIEDDKAKALREAGLVKLKSTGDVKADIKIISEELSQSETQTLINYMYQTVLNIVGMPNRNGGTSTSDTGLAVVYRDGWESAEARAKRDEIAFKRSERNFLKLVLKILRATTGTKVSLSDIDIKFTRRNYSDILTKSQVLITMLGCDKIDPVLAFIHCGMFSDPQEAAKMSEEHYQKVLQRQKTESIQESGVKDVIEGVASG